MMTCRLHEIIQIFSQLLSFYLWNQSEDNSYQSTNLYVYLVSLHADII